MLARALYLPKDRLLCYRSLKGMWRQHLKCDMNRTVFCENLCQVYYAVSTYGAGPTWFLQTTEAQTCYSRRFTNFAPSCGKSQGEAQKA